MKIIENLLTKIHIKLLSGLNSILSNLEKILQGKLSHQIHYD